MAHLSQGAYLLLGVMRLVTFVQCLPAIFIAGDLVHASIISLSDSEKCNFTFSWAFLIGFHESPRDPAD